MNLYLPLAAAIAVPLVLIKLRESFRLRALNTRYVQLATQKRQDVATSLAHAKAAGLSWDGFVAWIAAQQTPQPEVADVLSWTATELCAALAAARVSSEFVTRLFIARAMLVDEKLCCVTEQLYEAAVVDARRCDEELRSGSLRGPMHGLPISIKEQVKQKGFDATCGACCRLMQPANDDALLVRLLRDAGAIPFVRTNVPQLLMLPESFNAIYGTTCNPFDLTRTSGGSSGGESALVAARGSPLGLGTDVGGSIRGPAVMTGLCGFKSTVERLSYMGLAVPRRNEESGQKEVRSSAGPIGRSVDDCALLMASLCTPRMYEVDETIPPVPWDQARYEATASRRSLRFGFYVSDGWFEPAPACARAVRETVEALRAAGHTVDLFEPLENAALVPAYASLLAAEGSMHGFVEGIEGEAMHPAYRFLYKVARLPNWLRPLISFVQGRLLGQKRMATLVSSVRGQSTREYWQTIVQKDRLKKAFLARFDAAKLDALVCPGLGLPAFPHGTSVKLNQACSYTFVFNALNLPCGTVPVSAVHQHEQTYEDAANPDTIRAAAIAASAGSAGLPVGVQVVCPPWRDEQCLGAMKAVETALRAAGRSPPTPQKFMM